MFTRSQQIKRAPISEPFDLFVGYLSGDDVFRLWALLALRNGKLDPLAFGERFEAYCRDRVVEEQEGRR
jgi:hypothetical protein